jgi:hypothetical protein
MKATGAQYFRQPVKPNVRWQDGLKRRLLCGRCEQRFSVLERSFVSTVFKPVVIEDRLILEYDSSLIRFLASIAWRTLAVDLEERRVPPQFRPELEAAEREWREVLMGRQDFSLYNRFHMFVTESLSRGASNQQVFEQAHRCHD